MSMKLEEMFNEIQQQGINTAKNIVTSGNLSVGGTMTVTGAQTFAGAITVNASATVTGNANITGNVTVGGTLTVTGVATLVGAPILGATGTAGYTSLGTGGPVLMSGTLAPPANPTGITAAKGSIFINLTGTGVTNRVYINTDGATAWTFMGTSGV